MYVRYSSSFVNIPTMHVDSPRIKRTRQRMYNPSVIDIWKFHGPVDGRGKAGRYCLLRKVFLFLQHRMLHKTYQRNVVVSNHFYLLFLCVCFCEYFREPNLFLYLSEILPFLILNFKSFQFKQCRKSIKGIFYYHILYLSNWIHNWIFLEKC